MTGKLINLEGIDASGKGTHTQLIVKRLDADGFPVKTMSFPTYGTESCREVEKYLRGEYGTAEETGPWFASLPYGRNRWIETPQMRVNLEKGINYPVDRYTASNLGHQGAKIKSDVERKEFINWIIDLEFRKGIVPLVGPFIKKFPEEAERQKYWDWVQNPEFISKKIPVPDVTIFIDMPPIVSYQFVENKNAEYRQYLKPGEKRDIHEADPEHLGRAQASYLYAASILPNWLIIDPVKPEYRGDFAVLNNLSIPPEQKVRSLEDINNEIYDHVLSAIRK